MDALNPARTPYGRRPQFANVLRSESRKLWSVRSTYWALLATIGFNVVLAALLAIFLPGALSAHNKATVDSTRVSLGGIHLSQIATGLLGVLVITSEYRTGMIRASLSAVPQRRTLLTAKALVITTVAFVAGTASCFAAYYVFQAFLSASSLRTSIGDPGVLRAVMGGGLYLTILGLFGLGLGAIIRSSAGTVATLFGLLFVPPLMAELLPSAWKSTITPYVPLQAGSAILSAHRDSGSLAPWAGLAVFSIYAAVALALGFVLINRRDA